MSFDETIIHCSAPSLCGIKPACLFSLSLEVFSKESQKINKWKTDFSKFNRFIIPMKKENNRILMFIFDKKLLEKTINSKENSLYLKSKGYCVEKGFSSVLAELLHRLTFNKDFPHEVGIFLGYPLCDVIGFENNNSDFKYSGFWKVYANVNEAERQMQSYKSCSKKCMKLLTTGLSVPMVTQKFEIANKTGVIK